MGQRRVRLRICGRVQGVFYRDSTRREARRLGLRGWVRNRSDGSVVGYIGYPKAAIYTSTKWALRGLNETWREELYPDGIKCAYVAPGYVITGFNDRDEQGTAEEREWALFPEDVAHAVWCIATQGPHSDIKEIIIQVQDRS